MPLLDDPCSFRNKISIYSTKTIRKRSTLTHEPNSNVGRDICLLVFGVISLHPRAKFSYNISDIILQRTFSETKVTLSWGDIGRGLAATAIRRILLVSGLKIGYLKRDQMKYHQYHRWSTKPSLTTGKHRHLWQKVALTKMNCQFEKKG